MRRLVEHLAGAIGLATLMALLVPSSAQSLNPQATISAVAASHVSVQQIAAAATDGRWKLGGDGSCYWDPNDSGPDQCEQTGGRWKLGGDGSCYWDPNDSGPNQCVAATQSEPTDTGGSSGSSVF